MSGGGAGNPGSGGSAPGGGGNGAEAGSPDVGGAGAGGAPDGALLICQTGCESSEDCATPYVSATCDETLHLCVECTEHDDCIPKTNGWFIACTSDADCDDFSPACIDVGGVGRCAGIPDCILGVSTPYPRFGIEPVEMVDVCVVDSGRCNAQHSCFTGCTDAPDFCTSFSPGHGDTCDATTGECECASDAECTFTGHCNLTTHRCDECSSNDDCSGAPTGGECHDGRCGCSTIAACPDSSFPDGTTLCE